MVLVSQNYFEWDTDLPYFSLPLETKKKKKRAVHFNNRRKNTH